MKKLLTTLLVGFLAVSCGQDDEMSLPNSQNSKTESLMSKNGGLIITESVDLEIVETACFKNKKKYQAKATSTDVMNRSRTISYKIIDNMNNTVMQTGQFIIPAGLNQSSLVSIFPNVTFTTDITYEVTNVEIYPYVQDPYGNYIYDPIIGLYNYGTGVKNVDNCQIPVIGN